MPQLIVSRKTGAFGFMRLLEVEVDDAIYGSLSRGESGMYGVAPGAHTVRVRMDWCSSELEVSPGPDDVVELLITPPPATWWMLGYGMFGARSRRFFGIERVEPEPVSGA